MKNILNIAAILILFSVLSCKNTSEAELENGIWRATLKTESGAEIPFNFEVIDSADQKFIDVINGLERFRVNEISLNEDSVIIQMPLFDSEIRAIMKGRNLTGNWIKHYGTDDVNMKFDAQPNASWRFFKAKANSELNISGRWSATFHSVETKDTIVSVGEFSQKDGRLLGTFLTSVGDYRFLEGTVSDKNLYLSCFDGGHAYLFTGKILNDSTIVDGKFYSGLTSIENWAAKKDNKAILPDAYTLTSLKKGNDKIEFTFPDLNGKEVSLNDPKFRNKVTIVQFFGSWCPNCMDETAYLAPLYDKYKDSGLEIIGLAYERSNEFERSKMNVERLRHRFGVNYDMLITGYTDNANEVIKSMPMIENFEAFPTMIVIDKKGKVRKIHTGFNGPGTGSHYTQFAREFEATINDLLAEK